MAATPKYAVLTLMTAKNDAKGYSVYLSDVAAQYATLNTSGLAATTSQSFIIAPFSGYIADYAETTGTVDTNVRILEIDDVPYTVLDKVAHVNSNSQRPKVNIRFNAGAKIALRQQ